MSEAPVDGKGAAPGKKPYAKPRVREYGDVRKLTQSGGGTAQDKAGGSGKGFMTGV